MKLLCAIVLVIIGGRALLGCSDGEVDFAEQNHEEVDAGIDAPEAADAAK